MEAKIPPGRPQDDEKWSKNFSGAPPARISEFFSPPEASRSAPGSIFIASWQPPGAHWVPRWSPEASRRPPGGLPEVSKVKFGTIWTSYLHRCWLLLQLFSLPSWDLRDCLSHSLRVMFLFLFAGVLVFALCFWKASKP